LRHLEEKLARPLWVAAQVRHRRLAACRQLGVPTWILERFQRRVPPQVGGEPPSKMSE
jgi:hypothetical protein